MPEQLRFDIPARPALGRDAFFVSDSNAVALGLVDLWPNWPSGKLLITGPEGAGKTHLAHVWAEASGGRIVASTGLDTDKVPELADGPLCVEDADRITGDPRAENALFHLHNLTLANGHTLLLTATNPPAMWNLSLPDLASRMAAATLAPIADPDDRLLSIVLAKLFSDRQVVPKPAVLPYLVRHMPRSFAFAGRLVAAIDMATLGTKHGVTRDAARHVLATLLAQGDSDTAQKEIR